MHPSLRGGARASASAVGALVAWRLLNHGWRSVEAVTVAGAAAIGPGSVEWTGGDQLWVSGSAAQFVVVIGPWCSSAGPVLASIAVCTAFARTPVAIRSAALAAFALIVGNLVRMAAVVAIGARHGAADLEIAHDGWATWWAVAVVLTAAAILARTLRDGRGDVSTSVTEVATSS